MNKLRLNANAIKIIALITMTIDHVGLFLMHDYQPFRYIGRIAFPLFGYMLAEGCYYTRNKLKHFIQIFLLGQLCQIVYYVTEQSIYQGILKRMIRTMVALRYTGRYVNSGYILMSGDAAIAAWNGLCCGLRYLGSIISGFGILKQKPQHKTSVGNHRACPSQYEYGKLGMVFSYCIDPVGSL